MRKTTALSGAAQDAYFRRVFKGEAKLPAEAREHLVHRLKRDIAQVRLRRGPHSQALPAPPPAATPALAGSILEGSPATVQSFDPFSPNVIVLVRTAGRGGALAALAAIDDLDQLRLLAREQRLSVTPELSSLPELRAAIVAAAERRIANRLAAAS
jgi:hypothetical protein